MTAAPRAAGRVHGLVPGGTGREASPSHTGQRHRELCTAPGMGRDTWCQQHLLSPATPAELCPSVAVIRAKAVSAKEVDSGNDIYGNPIKRIQYEVKQIKVWGTVPGPGAGGERQRGGPLTRALCPQMFKGPDKDIEFIYTAPSTAVCGQPLDTGGKKEYLIAGRRRAGSAAPAAAGAAGEERPPGTRCPPRGLGAPAGTVRAALCPQASQRATARCTSRCATWSPPGTR